MTRTAVLALLLLAALPARAETIAITGGRVVTMGPAGDIPRGTVLVRDGRIAAVGADLAVPAGASVIDAAGRVVTPGLIAAPTTLGLIEVRDVDTSDDRATTRSDISAAFDVGYGLNPDSVLIPVARLGGITRAIVVPGYAGDGDRELLFAGQAAAVVLDGDARMVTKRGVAMVLGMGEDGAGRGGGGARGAAFAALKATLDEVRAYARGPGAYERSDYRLSRADLEALVPVVEGRMPLLVTAERASDIRDLLAFARAERLKLILAGGAEAWRVADQIAAAGVPVLLTPIRNVPNAFETIGATLRNAALLAAAGVRIVIEGNGPDRERELRYNAGDAVAHGLPWMTAMAAITSTPAQIFGLADRVGAIAPGKDADLVIWDGDPLEVMSRPSAIFIRGRAQPLRSRQTELRDRYLSTVQLSTEVRNADDHE